MRIKWRTFIHGVITAIVVVMVMGIITFPASADQNEKTSIQASADIQSLQTFKNKKTGRYISMGTFSSIPVSSTTPAKWKVRHWRDGTVELTIYNSNLALDDSAHGFRLIPSNKSKYQSWWVKRHSDGTISFKNQKTGRCIDDSNRYGLRTYKCNYSSYQRFY
ncbi:hypothetical protein KK120_17040 [Virgibacillus dakarensis]|nr:hypothetical protein [Virgibacillus dakarensis]